MKFLSWEITPKVFSFALLEIKSHQILVYLLVRGREKHTRLKRSEKIPLPNFQILSFIVPTYVSIFKGSQSVRQTNADPGPKLFSGFKEDVLKQMV